MRNLAVLLLLAFAVSAHAATLSPRDYDALRRRAFTVDDDRAAAAALESLTTSYEGDGAVWRALGDLRFDSGAFPQAADAYHHVFELGHGPRSATAWRIARAEARAGRPDSAYAWLDRALALGFERRPSLAQDSAFVALFGSPRFEALSGHLPKRAFTRDEGWRYDLDFLVGEVRRMHYLYRVQPLPPAFTSGVAALRARIPRMSDLAVTLEMQRLLVLLGDGHTTLYTGAGERVPLRLAGITLHAFADGIFVMDTADRSLVGARVERVGGHPIADVLAKLDPYMSRDNMSVRRVLPPYFLAFPEVLHELGLTPDANGVPLSGTKRDGTSFAVTIPVSETRMHPHIPKLAAAAFEGAPAAPAYLTRVEEPFWMDANEADSLAWFQFNQVANGEKETLAQAAARLSALVDAHATRVLVVDVRNNNGGNGNLLTPLLRTIVHFETTRPAARTFVITGPYTFSACQTFISQADRLTNAVFVGEPTGSKPTFVGEDTELLLPWSGTRGSISTRLHTSYPVEERTWIAPEIPVPSLSSDWLAGRDAAREAILAVIGAASSGVRTRP